MRMTFLSASIAGLIVLTGCAHFVNQQAAKEEAHLSAVCSAGLMDERISPLKSIVPINAEGASIAQLTDNRRFQAPEKAALAVLDEVMAACYGGKVAFARKYDAPAAAAVYQEYFQQERLLRAQAIRTDATIGAYNESRAQLVAKAYSAMAAARQQQARQQAEDEARNMAAWAAFSSAMQQSQQTQIMQQQLQQQQLMMNRPVQTNCTRWGTQVNCTSY